MDAFAGALAQRRHRIGDLGHLDELRAEERQLSPQRVAELSQRGVVQVLLHQRSDTHLHEGPHLHHRADLLRALHELLARHERHHLGAADHFAFDHDLPARQRDHRQIVGVVQPREARFVHFDEAAMLRRQRPRAGVELLDRDAFARGCRGQPAARLDLVHVARLHLHDVQLLERQLAQLADVGRCQQRPLRQRPCVLRQHHSRLGKLRPLQTARLHDSHLSSARRLARLCAGAKTLRCGSAACIPSVSGS